MVNNAPNQTLAGFPAVRAKSAVTHFSPCPSATGPFYKRVSTCGVVTMVGGLHGYAVGVSRLEWVDCPECLKRVVPWAPRQFGAVAP